MVDIQQSIYGLEQYGSLTDVILPFLLIFAVVFAILQRVKIFGKDKKNMYMTSFLQEIIDAGWRIKAVPVKNGWLEIDSVNDLQIYENLYKVGELASFCRLEN